MHACMNMYMYKVPSLFSLYYIAGYDHVCSHLVDITHVLETTKGACKYLTQHYIQMGWLENTEQPTEVELVRQALQRIKINPNQYEIFLTMLRNIKGLDLIVSTITGQGEVYIQFYYYFCSVVSSNYKDADIAINVVTWPHHMDTGSG